MFTIFTVLGQSVYLVLLQSHDAICNDAESQLSPLEFRSLKLRIPEFLVGQLEKIHTVAFVESVCSLSAVYL